MEEANISNQEFGKVTFANEVLATIAGIAACDIEGVAGMCGGFKDGIAELLGKKNLTKGVKVTVSDDSAAVDVEIIVNYGAKLPEVCAGIQESVSKALETMTGLKVTAVNISVEGLKFPEPEKTEE